MKHHTDTRHHDADGRCARCQVYLERRQVADVWVKACTGCGGILVPLGDVHQALQKDIQDRLIAKVRDTRRRGSRLCPQCRERMAIVTVPRGPRAIDLDICYSCDAVWFDATEADVLRAMYGMDDPPQGMVDRRWKWAAALVGMPVRRQHQPRLALPWVTWGLTALVIAVSLAAWYLPGLQLFRFGLVPAQATRFGAITLLTPFFLHGGYFHLFANMYFLVVFGALVEDYLGRPRYLLLLAGATVLGNLFQIALTPNSTVLTVGASGGISGVVVFYGLQFPRVRILVLWWLIPLRFRAAIALLIWILLQVLGAWSQIHGSGSVSHIAHLGGALVGLLLWLGWKTRLDAPWPAGVQRPDRSVGTQVLAYFLENPRMGFVAGAMVSLVALVTVAGVAAAFDPLRSYTRCQFADGLAVVEVMRTPGDRSVDTAEGRRTVRRKDGYRVMFAYPNTDYFVNFHVDLSRPGAYEADKRAIVAQMTHAARPPASPIEHASLHGYDVYAINDLAEPVISWYSLFDDQHGLTLTAYFLNQRAERRQFQTPDEYHALRDRFLASYAACVGTGSPRA
jgi:membrane associated rhomboid family serine protease/Zn-finger nucleic acid-binding protein